MKINFQSLRNINKTWLSLGVALAIGVLTALGARSFLSHQVEAIAAASKHETVDVVVAKTEITAGTKLSNQSLAVRKIPVDFAQSGAIRPEDFPRIDGKAIAYNLRSGEMIMWSQMEAQHVPTFSARLAPGQRAITVVVDEINSISGMLEPGDLIDLMFAVDQNGQKVVLPLLQSVQVMATGQRVVDDARSGEKTQFATVTLNTTPEQATSIIMARETGKLTALLRNPNDKAPIGNRSLDLASLFGSRRVAHQGPQGMRQVPVLYGGSGAKFAPEALRLNSPRPPLPVPASVTPTIATASGYTVAALPAGAALAPGQAVP
ncbi:Flp pilus assembly protein CpaB [Massilia solisilvae]|uniref:Flp pilus assembly protein CpaB n=1 Tax=Massilia solisilvae TaxID=1811225 RepID=A0ABT2BDR8_9BURK|nr:Flp pilus assembly protein CpaB [Massilia solisilvae]MCS0606666.1 Flp pilus assembly protein CpaB [Massilia solisilvae]